MNHRLFSSLMLLFILMTASGCEFIEGVFQAGAIVGIIGVLVVAGIVFFLIRAFRG